MVDPRVVQALNNAADATVWCTVALSFYSGNVRYSAVSCSCFHSRQTARAKFTRARRRFDALSAVNISKYDNRRGIVMSSIKFQLEKILIFLRSDCGTEILVMHNSGRAPLRGEETSDLSMHFCLSVYDD